MLSLIPPSLGVSGRIDGEGAGLIIGEGAGEGDLEVTPPAGEGDAACRL